MESFYTQPMNISDSNLNIRDDEFYHLTRVMRKKTGDQILVVDGKGKAFECLIDKINRDEAHCTIRGVHQNYNEPQVNVTLMLPILKNHNRVEWIVEKGTELGVRSFIPVKTERTVPNKIRYDRLHKIAIAAMKQCKRSYLPSIQEGERLTDILNKVDVSFDKVFIGHEGAPVTESIRRVSGQLSNQRVLLLAGPEGGFTDEEMRLCEQNGGQVVSLGVRRYRAETAALIMAVNIIYD